MCGNGGRCIVAFAEFLGIFKNTTTFYAIDGLHHAKIEENLIIFKWKMLILLKLYYIIFRYGISSCSVDNLKTFNIESRREKIRYGAQQAGSNVNFVEKLTQTHLLFVLTKGSEDETLSCGTGVTAVAIACMILEKVHQIY